MTPEELARGRELYDSSSKAPGTAVGFTWDRATPIEHREYCVWLLSNHDALLAAAEREARMREALKTIIAYVDDVTLDAMDGYVLDTNIATARIDAARRALAGE